ncbi:DedA family protein [Methanococcoides burtonii]|uniref:Membrane-associated protein, SNARE-like n=1 Tax=Methanococcoides burtonii (strain DSM 6242 / NBRC 107633 / OCM 468 / ACE-M) TaxID=259564 RepID=Q12ZG0_METBU|nr:DedA family protein [Methanococcoides burtonii]ABE51166.1 membrane-associated protein, SNARE-like [Methanococcoides burtonii DSM 6242]
MIDGQFSIPYLEHLSYAGIFITLAVLGHFIPLPEEVLLLTIGYFVSLGFGNLGIVIVVSLIAGCSGDILLYWLSKNGSKLFLHLNRNINEKKIVKYENLMQTHDGKTVFVLRLIVGLRFFGPVVAGSANVAWRKFLFYDLLALLIYYPSLIFLGYHFHNNLRNLISEVGIFSHIIFFIVVGLFGIAISIYSKKKF